MCQQCKDGGLSEYCQDVGRPMSDGAMEMCEFCGWLQQQCTCDEYAPVYISGREIDFIGTVERITMHCFNCDQLRVKLAEAKMIVRWVLDWVDAVPSSTPLPTMLGFDRDYVENFLSGEVDHD